MANQVLEDAKRVLGDNVSLPGVQTQIKRVLDAQAAFARELWALRAVVRSAKPKPSAEPVNGG